MRFHIFVSKSKAEKSSQTDNKTDFNIKWHLIEGQGLKGHWKADKSLHDTT